MAAGLTHFDADGKSVTLPITATVVKDRVVVIDGWVGVSNGSGNSGDSVAVGIDLVERQLEVPSGFDPAVADIIYVTIATITGHYPDDAAYTNSSGAGKIALGKVTVAKGSTDIVNYITLPNLLS